MEVRRKLRVLAKQMVVMVPIVLSVVACSVLAPDQDGIVLANNTETPVVYIAIELELSHSMDPQLAFTIGPDQEGYVPAGESAKVENENIMGYTAGDDVRFFIYEVVSEEATLKDLLTFTDRELRALDYRIEVEAL